MNKNLYSKTEESYDSGEWISKQDYGNNDEYGTYGNNSKGPLTALRILKDETNFDNIYLEQLFTFGTPQFGLMNVFTRLRNPTRLLATEPYLML